MNHGKHTKPDRGGGQYHLRHRIETAGPDLIRENTPIVTGPEAMTDREKVRYIMTRYGYRKETQPKHYKRKT